jgi:hypothetical protein
LFLIGLTGEGEIQNVATDDRQQPRCGHDQVRGKRPAEELHAISQMPNADHFYQYREVPTNLTETLKQLTLEAYCAVEGKGYGRVDIRMDAQTGKLYVLEVNAQCGLSEDEDYTSIGAILRLSNKSFEAMVSEIIEEAMQR